MWQQSYCTLSPYVVACKDQALQSGEACNVGSQCCGTHIVNVVAAEVELTQGGEACVVRPQCHGALAFDVVATDVEV